MHRIFYLKFSHVKSPVNRCIWPNTGYLICANEQVQGISLENYVAHHFQNIFLLSFLIRIYNHNGRLWHFFHPWFSRGQHNIVILIGITSDYQGGSLSQGGIHSSATAPNKLGHLALSQTLSRRTVSTLLYRGKIHGITIHWWCPWILTDSGST